MSGSRPVEGSEPWLRRYARQVVLEGFGEEGQRRLGKARVSIFGRCPAVVTCAVHLAAAGVGAVGVGDKTPLSADEAAVWPLVAADVGVPRGKAVVRVLRSLGCDAGLTSMRKTSADMTSPLAAPHVSAGVVLLLIHDSAERPRGTCRVARWIALVSDGAGGVLVSAAEPPATRPLASLPARGPVLLAGAALAADAAMRMIVTGEAPRGAIRVRADGTVVGG